jgi:hypothetical protein
MLLLLLAQHLPRPQLLSNALDAGAATSAAATDATTAATATTAACLLLGSLAGPEPDIAGRHVNVIKQLHD